MTKWGPVRASLDGWRQCRQYAQCFLTNAKNGRRVMLEQVAYLAEILSALVVAATLIFLTKQMRQNNRILRSAATQHAHSQYADVYNDFVNDPSMLEIYVRAQKGLANLQELELARLNAFWMKATLNYQNWFLQTREGALDHSVLDSYEKLVVLISRTEPWQSFWKLRRGVFHEEFVQHVDEVIALADPEQKYRPFGLPRESRSGTGAKGES